MKLNGRLHRERKGVRWGSWPSTGAIKVAKLGEGVVASTKEGMGGDTVDIGQSGLVSEYEDTAKIPLRLHQVNCAFLHVPPQIPNRKLLVETMKKERQDPLHGMLPLVGIGLLL
ncbi:MAG: hypothetical protein V3R30_13230, partial [Kiloniellales bacterium]